MRPYNALWNDCEAAQNIQRDYTQLLRLNLSDSDAEDLVILHYIKDTTLDYYQSTLLWLALAEQQKVLGRLSDRVKNQAINCAKKLGSCDEHISPQNIIDRLEAPDIQRKKIRITRTCRCPWPVGGLLAYRIVSSKHPHVTNSPYYKKYVLLRIIAIKRHPISKLAPEACWNESMLVGLYNWVGTELPDINLARTLQFTEIVISQPLLPRMGAEELPGEKILPQTNPSMELLAAQRIETCCSLDWKCAKGIPEDRVFTYLGCDAGFEQISPFFKINVTQYSLAHSLPFDAMLVNRLTQLAEAGNLNDSTILHGDNGTVCVNPFEKR